MSVVAAKVYDNRIVIAADSILVRYGMTKENNYSKLEYINGMIIGGSGYASESSLMYRFAQTHKPETPTEKDMLAFIIEFYNWKKDFGNTDLHNQFLSAYEGHLFEVRHLFIREINDFMAIGAGEDFARAALYLGHTPREATEVACALSCYVSEPIKELVMEKKKGGRE